jgi:hypothetical protein
VIVDQAAQEVPPERKDSISNFSTNKYHHFSLTKFKGCGELFDFSGVNELLFESSFQET